VPHPVSFLTSGDAGERLVRETDQEGEATRVGRAQEPAEFHRARHAEAALERRHEHLAIGEHDNARHRRRVLRERHVVAALAFDRQAHTERTHQQRCLRPGGENQVVRGLAPLARVHRPAACEVGLDRTHLAAHEPPATHDERPHDLLARSGTD